MIPDTRLLVPLDELPEFDEVGLWLYMTEPGWISPRLLCTGAVELRGSYRVSLTDASTRDRCLRWLAGRVGLTVGQCGAGWWSSYTHSQPGWELAHPDDQDHLFWADKVSALIHFDPTDDTRLPDGSRLVDALALAAVLRQVGTNPRSP